MAKDRESSKPTHAEKEEKKNSKKKRSAEDGVHKSSSSDKKDKKDKKAKRSALAEKALNEISSAPASAPAEEGKSDDDDEEGEVVVAEAEVEAKTKQEVPTRPVGALVPFANPLADDKVAKKVFKSVKKAAAQRTLKRGVKEVVKALRKSAATTTTPNTPTSTPTGVVVLAADISPMDVISHIPVLCEDHGVPYIYVTSRAELGMAGQTKRPTSVVMVVGSATGKKKGKDGKDAAEVGDGTGEEWDEVFKGLVKTVEREGRHVKV